MTRREPYFETTPLYIYVVTSFIVGALACWPIFLSGSVFVYFDTGGYLSNGAAILRVLADYLWPTTAVLTEPAATEDAVDKGRAIRSFVYSAYVYFGSLTPLGHFGPVLGQSILISAVALLLVPRAIIGHPILLTGALLALLVATPLPFYAGFYMPDILAAAIILGAMILARGTNARGYVVVGVALAFAASSHYGHLPLALGLLVVVGLWHLVRRSLTPAFCLTIALPLTFAVIVNIAGGKVAFGQASFTPHRFPIMLARSLADGPVRWHLEQNCDQYNYEICKHFDEFPDNVGAALWQEGGLGKIKSVEVLDRIRAEEPLLLWRGFLDYPGLQTWSLGRNAALQLMRFGLSDVYVGAVINAPDGTYKVNIDKAKFRSLFDGLEYLHLIVVLLSLVYLLVTFRKGRTNVDQIGVLTIMLLCGLALNAGIFGGLSAPVDRYGGRVIWILPMLAALVFLAGRVRDDHV